MEYIEGCHVHVIEYAARHDHHSCINADSDRETIHTSYHNVAQMLLGLSPAGPDSTYKQRKIYTRMATVATRKTR